MHRSRFLIVALGLLAVLGLSQCGGSHSRSAAITIKGSDTMVILGQRWAEAYMEATPGSVIQVTGGGSGTGIAALLNGTTDVCQSSRPMKPEEQAALAQKGTPAHEILVARDGLALYVPTTSPVDSLTLAQLKQIYTGAITNWKALGGPDAPIVVYGRENNSGTYVYFKEHVLAGADFAAGVQTLPGTAAVVNAVAQEARGIGYGGAAYAKGVKEVAIKQDDATPAVRPTREAVLSGAYPISRGLFWYTRGTPSPAVQALVDYALSPAGQALVSEVGYYPVQ